MYNKTLLKMRSKTTTITLMLLLVLGVAFAQNTEEKEKPEKPNKVEKAEKTVNETNAQIDSTIVGVDNTIEGAKETAKKVGEILFGKKGKKKKAKNQIVISISAVSYDNLGLNNLYKQISKSKGVSKVIKTFSNNQAILKIESKLSADDIWQKVSKDLRATFKVGEIQERAISITPKN